VVGYEGEIREELKVMLFDPQTAGGLLVSVGEANADELRRELNEAGVRAVEIGEVLPQGKPLITVAR
jgi:selenide,water dikinase